MTQKSYLLTSGFQELLFSSFIQNLKPYTSCPDFIIFSLKAYSLQTKAFLPDFTALDFLPAHYKNTLLHEFISKVA